MPESGGNQKRDASIHIVFPIPQLRRDLCGYANLCGYGWNGCLALSSRQNSAGHFQHNAVSSPVFPGNMHPDLSDAHFPIFEKKDSIRQQSDV